MKVVKPICEKPLLLVNRAAVNALKLGGSLLINNQVLKVKYFSYSDFYKLLPVNFDQSIIENFEVHHHQYRDNLFIYVPCNKCVLCKQKRQNDLIFRSSLESSLYDVPPYFFTLTYSPKYLPQGGELCYSDVQKFFKRLRRYYERKGIETNLRYIVAGEYGSKSVLHRPHYHVILYNNPLGASLSDPIKHRQLANDIFRTWGKCEPQAFDFSQCRGGAASYVTKYCSKINPPTYGHMHKPFIHMSTRHGGIGSKKIDEYIQYCRTNLSISSLTYNDKGSLKSVNFGSYIQNRIWPSPTRLVPYKVRDFYRQYSDIVHTMARLRLITYKYAFHLLEINRPYKTVLPNAFDHHKAKVVLHACPTFKKLLANRYHIIFNDLLHYIHENDGDIDPNYLDSYYKYKDMHRQSSLDVSFAWKMMKAREKVKNSEMKEKL